MKILAAVLSTLLLVPGARGEAMDVQKPVKCGGLQEIVKELAGIGEVPVMVGSNGAIQVILTANMEKKGFTVLEVMQGQDGVIWACVVSEGVDMLLSPEVFVVKPTKTTTSPKKLPNEV